MFWCLYLSVCVLLPFLHYGVKIGWECLGKYNLPKSTTSLDYWNKILAHLYQILHVNRNHRWLFMFKSVCSQCFLSMDLLLLFWAFCCDLRQFLAPLFYFVNLVLQTLINLHSDVYFIASCCFVVKKHRPSFFFLNSLSVPFILSLIKMT